MDMRGVEFQIRNTRIAGKSERVGSHVRKRNTNHIIVG